MIALRTLVASLIAIAIVGCAAASRSHRAAAIDPAKLVDRSYSLGPETIYWPTAQPFELRRVAYGRTPGGYWYASNNLSMAEHGGTHLDLPAAGATFIALPLKIEQGSGGPTRIVALLP